MKYYLESKLNSEKQLEKKQSEKNLFFSNYFFNLFFLIFSDLIRRMNTRFLECICTLFLRLLYPFFESIVPIF